MGTTVTLDQSPMEWTRSGDGVWIFGGGGSRIRKSEYKLKVWPKR